MFLSIDRCGVWLRRCFLCTRTFRNPQSAFRIPHEPAVHRVAKAGVAELQVVVGDPAATGEELEGELHRFEAEVAFDGLEVGLAFAGGSLEGLYDGLAL